MKFFLYIYIDFLVKLENSHTGKVNKTCLVNIFALHSLQGQFSGTHFFIFALKFTSDPIVLYSFGTSFHNLELG